MVVYIKCINVHKCIKRGYHAGRVMTFLLRAEYETSRQRKKEALLTGLACTKELTDFSWRNVWYY